MTNFRAPAGFSISAAAKAQIGRIKAEYDTLDPGDPATMPGISIGWSVGQSADLHVVVAFWRRSEFTQAAAALVHEIAGVPIVFMVADQYRPLFAGRTLDYSPHRAFFLR
jgi:hypothetical protein